MTNSLAYHEILIYNTTIFNINKIIGYYIMATLITEKQILNIFEGRVSIASFSFEQVRDTVQSLLSNRPNTNLTKKLLSKFDFTKTAQTQELLEVIKQISHAGAKDEILNRCKVFAAKQGADLFIGEKEVKTEEVKTEEGSKEEESKENSDSDNKSPVKVTDAEAHILDQDFTEEKKEGDNTDESVNPEQEELEGTGQSGETNQSEAQEAYTFFKTFD